MLIGLENSQKKLWLRLPLVDQLCSLGMGFSMAGTILIAQYVGAKNKEMVNKGAAQTLLSVVIISAFLSVLGYFSAEHILLLM